MRLLQPIFLLFLGSFQPATAADKTGDMNIGAASAEACASCHNSVVSLKDRGADVIARQMKAIRAGEKGHPPGLADLNDDEIMAIAAYLDGA